MSEKKYLDADAAYGSGTLTDWYISSVDDNPPIWTDEHIYELMNDFYVIPKDTKPADVVPVVRCSECEHFRPFHSSSDSLYGHCLNRQFYGVTVRTHDFCSYASEKREQEKLPIPEYDDHNTSGLLEE